MANMSRQIRMSGSLAAPRARIAGGRAKRSFARGLVLAIPASALLWGLIAFLV